MLYDVPHSFQQKLDDWNAGHPLHPPVAVRWDAYAVRQQKIVWSYGVPIQRWAWEPRWQVGVLLNNRPVGMEKYSTYLKGSGGMWFIRLFSWQVNQSVEQSLFLDLDDRIFTCLGEGDMTRRDVVAFQEEQEQARDDAANAHGREVTKGSTGYYRNHDKLTLSMNPEVKAGAGWRWRNR